MPAWITSEFRELVCVPIASSPSRITTSRPARASARATASPTTPAPTTAASSLSTREHPFEDEHADRRYCGDARHRARGAVEGYPEQRAEQRARSEADGTDQRRGGACRLRERRERHRRRAGKDQRAAEENQRERQDEREPVLRAAPRQRARRDAAFHPRASFR